MKWTSAFSDYPRSAGWALTWYVRGVGALDVTADADPASADGWLATITPTQSGALAAGTYQIVGRVSLAGEVYPVGSGVVTVTPNLATAAAGALQSHAEQMVPLLRAEIKARVAGDGTAHKGYTIEGRSIEKFSLAELRGLLKGYELELAAIRNGGRLPPYRAVFTRAR